MKTDQEILKSLAEQYVSVSGPENNDPKRELWSRQHSLLDSPPPVLCRFGMHNAWAYRFFTPQLQCGDPFLRSVETQLRVDLFHAETGDDHILEPWLIMGAVFEPANMNDQAWGMPLGKSKNHDNSAWTHSSPLKNWDDLAKIHGQPHKINEQATQDRYAKLYGAIGGMIPIEIDRGPYYRSFNGDIATDAAELRGLENLMMDMYLNPEKVHELLGIMRDTILLSHEAAEKAGHLTSANQTHQEMPYSRETPVPAAGGKPGKRSDFWCFAAAQEYTLISPEMHDEFLLQYQLPILEKYKLVQYGCCENLTKKIDMLRKIPNLRVIAVTPSADVKLCAEQIGTDYCISWRPNPTEVICTGFEEGYIHRFIRDNAEIMKGLHFSVVLKDVETVQNQPERWKKWTAIAKKAVGR